MMRLPTRRTTPTDALRDAAIAALVTALDDGQREATDKRGLTGVRAVAAGAALYATGRAAFKRRRFIQERLTSFNDARAEEDEDLDSDVTGDEAGDELEDSEAEEEGRKAHDVAARRSPRFQRKQTRRAPRKKTAS